MSSSTTTSTITVVTVDVDGTARQQHWTPRDDGSLLEQLQAAVQGSVDVVRLSGQLDMWLNDEGL